jgi:hypothetical protein
MKIDLKKLAHFEAQNSEAPNTITFIIDILSLHFMANEIDSSDTEPVFQSLQELGIVSEIEEDFEE